MSKTAETKTDTSTVEVTPENVEKGLVVPGAQPELIAHKGPRDMLEGLDLAGMREVAEWMSKTAMVPDKFIGKPDDMVVCFMYAAELGISPMNGLTSIAVVNGTPSVYGMAVTALVKHAPGYCGMVETNNFAESENLKSSWAKCVMKRQLPTGTIEEHSKTYTYVMALAAGLTGKPNWKSYPAMMLENRARNWCARVAFPEALKGLPVHEEVEDLATMARANVEPEQKGSAGLADTLDEKVGGSKITVEPGEDYPAAVEGETRVHYGEHPNETGDAIVGDLNVSPVDGGVARCISIDPEPPVWLSLGAGEAAHRDYIEVARAQLLHDLKQVASDSDIASGKVLRLVREAADADSGVKIDRVATAPLVYLVRLHHLIIGGVVN